MFACRPNFLHVGPSLHAVFLHVEPPPNLSTPPARHVRLGPAVRQGRLGLVKMVKFAKPFKKMRLDESFRMVPVSCHLEVVVKSYDQNTVNMSLDENSKFEIWGTALHAVFLHVLPPPVPLTCSLKYRPDRWPYGHI